MENGGTWTGGVIEVVELREKRGWWSISVVGGPWEYKKDFYKTALVQVKVKVTSTL